jgi:hypothetical protein
MADPVQITQNQIGFAPEVAPFAQDVLGSAQALTSYDQNPYQSYTGEQVAQFSPLQQQSYDYAKQMTSAPQLQDATSLAGMAGLGGLNAQYTYKPSDFGSTFTKDAQGNLTSPLMNPYLNVMDTAARRNADISKQQLGAQAATHGAFGGSRDAIMQAQANAELQRNLGQNQYNAFNQAQQQYNTQQQQNAQQQQFGANLGMQGLQTALTGANALGSLGQTQFAQNVGLTGLQNQLGLQQQQQAQNVLNTNYQNFMAEQNDPYKRLGFYSDIVRGAPLTQTGSSVYQASPTAMQNLTSLGLGAYGLNSLFGSGTGKAAGGAIKGYATGGSVTSREFKEYAVDNVPSQMLPTVQRNAQARGDLDTYQLAMEQMAQDAAMRRGIAPALPPGVDVIRAAGGGILAFAGDEDENDPQTGQMVADYRLGPADPALLKKGVERTQELADFTPQELTPDQENIAYTNYFNRAKTLLGKNQGMEDFRKYINEAQADRGAALEQAKGVGALKAAAAVLQPGGFMRGLGAAGSAFADVYGQAQQADRKEKQYLATAGFHLADAERKEHLGLTKEASSAMSAYKSSIKDANKFNLDKLKYTADATVKLAQTSRQLAPRGGAGGPKPKLAEDTASMMDQLETIKSSNPNWAEDPKARLLESKIKARVGLVGVGKEPLNKPDQLANALEAKVTKDAETAWENMNRLDRKTWAKQNGFDPKYLGSAKDKYVENYKATTKPTKGDVINPAGTPSKSNW